MRIWLKLIKNTTELKNISLDLASLPEIIVLSKSDLVDEKVIKKQINTFVNFQKRYTNKLK